jgi:hypothetical protein
MATADTTSTVTNVAPTISNVSATVISEGQSTTLTGAIVDPGVRDTFTLLIDWGDGGTSSVPLAAGATSFSVTHLYVDDDPTGTPSDNMPIMVTIVDDDRGQMSVDSTVTVNNLPPVLSNALVSPAELLEGDSVTFTGAISDAGHDSFVLTVNWGDNTSETHVFGPGVHSINLTHRYPDDNPSGTSRDAASITVSVLDDDTGLSAQTSTVQVLNTSPTIDGVAAVPVSRDARTTLTGNFQDRGPDSFTVFVDWGDGTVDRFDNVSAGAFTYDYVYMNGNPNLADPAAPIPVTVTVVDDDGGTASFSTQADVLGTGISVQRIDTTPRVPRLQLPTTTIIVDTSARIPTTYTRMGIEEGKLVGDSKTVEEVEVSLRVVTPTGEEQEVVKLHLDVLDDLRSFFASLPDGHYRVYITQEGFERLVLDVHLRRGKVVVPEQNEPQRRPAAAQPEAAQPEVADPKVSEPNASEPTPNLRLLAPDAAVTDYHSAGRAIPDEVWAQWAVVRQSSTHTPSAVAVSGQRPSTIPLRHTECAYY